MQIAKALGAEVTAVVSTRNVELVRSIGADHVIDYTREDFTKNGQQYDFILDNVSNHSLSDLRRALTPTGMLVPNGGRFDNRWMASGGRIVQGKVLFRFGSQTLGNFLVSMDHEDLLALKELIEAGTSTPVHRSHLPAERDRPGARPRRRGPCPRQDHDRGRRGRRAKRRHPAACGRLAATQRLTEPHVGAISSQ